MIKKTVLVITTFMLLSIVAIPFAGDSLVPTAAPVRAQNTVESDDLAKFVAVMQYIRSQPTPADVDQNLFAAFFALLDTKLSEIYITGFITPFTGETPEQVEARLQSIPEEDRFTAVMVESYRLASEHDLLDLIHGIMAQYYVDIFIKSMDLSGASAYLKGTDIESLADAFNSSDYDLSAPSTTGTPPPSTRSQDAVDSDDLARFVAVMQYIRSQPTPADVDQNLLAAFFALLDTKLSEIYITGFITPFTRETPQQVEARLQSVPEEDRFIAVMVESYRLASDHDLLDLIHGIMAQYYVDIFIKNMDLSGASAYLGGTDIESLADAFDSTDYNLPAPIGGQTPTATATPSTTPVSTATPTIAELVTNVQGGVVQILTITSSGSGFIIDSDGRVVTNQHVVGGNQSITVRMHDGTEYPAVVLGVDPVADLAIVDIVPEIALQPVPLGDSDLVQLGEEVVAIGYPLGYQLGQSMVVTDGIISSKHINNGVEELQTNAAINPGNSGGPLFNRAGQVIGVNTSKIEYTLDGRPVDNTAFAVAINELKARLDTLKGSGSPQPVTTPTPVPTPVTPVPTPSAAPTPPPLPAGWNRYNNGVYGFSVDIPPRWTLDEDTEELNFAKFSAPDNKAGFSVGAYDLPSSYSLQAFVEWSRDWWAERARDESWNVFEITSFVMKQEGGKEFYELIFRAQSSDEFCVDRVTNRIYISSWYPGKPHGFIVGTGVCENSLNIHSTNARVVQDSFTEWMPYWNPSIFGLNVAPGWTLDKASETDGYALFWAPGRQGVFEIEAFEVGASETLEDFANWRIDILNRLSDSWEVFEPAGTFGLGGTQGARDAYVIAYVAQTDSEYCVSGNVEFMALSSFHPEYPVGFLVVSGVCIESPSYDQLDDQRWEMIYGFKR